MPQTPLSQHQERLAQDPRDAMAFEALEEHHYLRGDWSALERLYERRLTAELRNGSASEQARILVRLGQMLERGHGDVDAALRRYREAAERAPHFRPALTALRKAHASAGRWELVLQIAERELEMPLPGRARAELHLACGDTWLRHAGDEDQALCHFRLAAQDDPKNGEAWVHLAGALERAGESEEAARSWECAMPLLGGSERAQARITLARLVELWFDDDARAAALYHEAIRDDPKRHDALSALTDLAARRGDWNEVLNLQTRRFELTADAGERSRIAYGAARGRVEHADDALGALPWIERAFELSAAEGAIGRAMLLELMVETARVAHTTGHTNEAAELYERALGMDADNADALAGVAETRYELGDLDAATDAVQARLAIPGRDERRTLHVAISAAGFETRGELEEALAGYREVLAADPGHDAALAGAARILEAQDAYDEAAVLMDDWAKRTNDPNLRAERLTRAAQLARDAGADDLELGERLEAALQADPSRGDAWLLLVQVRYEAGYEDEALDASRRALATVREPNLRAELLATRATVLEERGEVRAAAGAWATAAAEQPEDPQPLACAMHLLRADGDWKSAARLLERVGQRVPAEQGDRRADVLAELGKLRAGPLEDMDGGIAAYREALSSQPGREDVRETLEKLLLYRAEPIEASLVVEDRGLRSLLGGLLKN
ncbi:MAG: tetratricopeptide repeat protein [Deltaproteobacteria bacterium]|nr:tetratricopeptide repeat protein [Deltaproteobacteria bacterium]MBW2447433.1 tetratricopeptide repeat protein [Deltaproteobacteria bacterium]